MLGTVLIAIGAIFLISGLVYLIVKVPKSRREQERRTAEVPGTITHEREVRRRKKSTKLYYDMLYTVNGQQFQLKDVRSMTRHTVGEKVRIAYNPEDPEDAHANELHSSPEETKKSGIVLLIVGAVVAVIGVICMFMAK